MKVLMIEDYDLKAADLIRILTDMGISDIDVAENKADGIETLENNDYDLLLLDMYFPLDPNGFEYPMCGLHILDWMQMNDRHFPVIVTSSLKMDLTDQKDVIGQVHYGYDDEDFRLKELIDSIPYLGVMGVSGDVSP